MSKKQIFFIKGSLPGFPAAASSSDLQETTKKFPF
jgi:hypothetical protein